MTILSNQTRIDDDSQQLARIDDDFQQLTSNNIDDDCNHCLDIKGNPGDLLYTYTTV